MIKPEWTEWHEAHAAKIELIAGIDCWIWSAGATPSRSHGRVKHTHGPEYAHRAAFAEFNGFMPKDGGSMICHSCGVGLCVRPSHLYLGDAATNGRDMAEMGTHRGRLTRDQVFALRTAYMNGEPLSQIADRFGIAFGTVYPIVIGKSYRHYPPPVGLRAADRFPRKLSNADIAAICARLNAGDVQSRIAADFGVAQSRISKISSSRKSGRITL